MNTILNPDRTRKNIVSVDEATARGEDCPIDIQPDDIFIINAPEIPEGMVKPKLSLDGKVWTESAGQVEIDALAVSRQDAEAMTALAVIDAQSIRAIREYIAARPDAPQILIDHETAAIAERAKLKP